MPNNADIAKQSGLEAKQPGAAQLKKLLTESPFDVAGLVTLLNRERRLTNRLLQLANQKSAEEFGNDRDFPPVTSAEAAVKCVGVDVALVAAMTDPLARAVSQTFETKLNMVLNSNIGTFGLVLDVPHIMGTAVFGGPARGEVQFRMSRIFAYEMAGRILRAAPSELATAEVFDVVGELVNMIVGNFKSHLGYESTGSDRATPTVGWANDFELDHRPGGASERLLFTSQEVIFFVDTVLESFSVDNPLGNTPHPTAAAQSGSNQGSKPSKTTRRSKP